MVQEEISQAPEVEQVENLKTGHRPVGWGTQKALDAMRRGPISHVNDLPVFKPDKLRWPDGTRRLNAKDFGEEDLKTFTRFKDRCVYDESGRYVYELCVALHEEYLDRKQATFFEKFKGIVQHAPSNKVGRNDPCPCGATKPAPGLPLELEITVSKKYKHCHGSWQSIDYAKSVGPARTEEVTTEEQALLDDPKFQELSTKYKAGEIGIEHFYEAMGFKLDESTGEYVPV